MGEKVFSEKEIRILVEMKKSIILPHKKCGGTGYIKKGERVEVCQCSKVFRYLRGLVYSRIPSDYWSLSLESMRVKVEYKRLVERYIDNLDNAIIEGLGMMFLGDRGIGKTSLMCEVGKVAVVKRYDVFYELMQNIVNDHYSEDKKIQRRVMEADLVVVDELEKVMMRENSNIPKQIDTFFRMLLPNKKAVLINTNLSEEEVEEKFKLNSLFKRYIKFVRMEGNDYSETKQAEWDERLEKTELDYFNPNILRNAEKHFENEHIANEREYNSLFKGE